MSQQKKEWKAKDGTGFTPVEIVAKFLGAGLFGCLISLILLVILFRIPELLDTWFMHVLWIVPVLCGIVGIFWFDPMLKLASRVFESFFRMK